MGGVVHGRWWGSARLGVAALCLHYPVFDAHACAGADGRPVVDGRPAVERSAVERSAVPNGGEGPDRGPEVGTAPRKRGAKASTEERAVRELERLTRRWSEAVSRGDVDAVTDLVAEDATLALPGEPLMKGREAIDRRLRRLFEAFELEALDVKVVVETEEQGVVGDRAYQRYTTRTLLRPRGGGEVLVRKGKGVRILEREADGCWRILREVWTGPGIPPAEEPVLQDGSEGSERAPVIVVA